MDVGLGPGARWPLWVCGPVWKMGWKSAVDETGWHVVGTGAFILGFSCATWHGQHSLLCRVTLLGTQ